MPFTLTAPGLGKLSPEQRESMQLRKAERKFDPIPEKWRSVPDYPEYLISSEGRLRGKKGKLRKPYANIKNGYLYTDLRKNNEPKKFYVHRLVLWAFCGPKPSNIDGAHIDGDRTNNRLHNLRWSTRKENEKDKIRHGRTKRDFAKRRAALLEGGSV